MPRFAPRFLVALVFSLLVCFGLLALASTGSASDHAKKPRKGEVSVTGCLQKGTEKNGYYINDGTRMWELDGKSDELDKHVGHQVTVTGKEEKKSKSTESKIATNERGESGGKDVADLKVKTLKHISETCSGPQF